MRQPVHDRFFIAGSALLSCLLLAGCGDHDDTEAGTQTALVGDLDGDGLSELIVVYRRVESWYHDYYSERDYGDKRERGGRVLVFSQGAEGTLEKGQTFRVGKGPTSVAMDDLDRDGLPDLAVACYDYERNISVLLGDPAEEGSFLSVKSLLTGYFPVAIATGDLDDDGAADLATASERFGLSVHFQDPVEPAKFFPAVTLAPSADSVAVGDFDDDGKTDIAYTGEGSVWVLFQNPASPVEFPDGIEIEAGVEPILVVAGHLNDDGLLDLAVADWRGDDGVLVLLQDSPNPGTFLAPKALSIGRGAWWVMVGDLDDDGLNDLAVAPRNISEVLLFFQDPAEPGEFLPEVAISTARRPVFLTSGDLNDDGLPELVVVPEPLRQWVEVFPQDAARPGTFLESFRVKY